MFLLFHVVRSIRVGVRIGQGNTHAQYHPDGEQDAKGQHVDEDVRP